MTTTAVHRLALLGALTGAFETLHPAADQLAQRDSDAVGKAAHGGHLVYADDGKPADGTRGDAPTLTASQYGRRCAARHVASYTAVQLGATVAVTRALGYRVPPAALLAGAAVNGVTHGVIDRRKPLLWALGKLRKNGYLGHATVVRRRDPDTGELVTDTGGPGTALMECDQAAHRAIGLAAAAVTTWLATRD